MNANILNYSGYADKLDLETPSWEKVFGYLEAEQDYFLKNTHQFRGRDYKWPFDALHNWSRVWEYPYVYLQIPKNGSLKIMDFGSGVTFFPHVITKIGHDVACVDIDPVCRRDSLRAGEFYNREKKHSGAISVPENGKIDRLGEYDLIYSISVLEHIRNPEKFIKKFYDALKPGGRLILTMDIDMRGGQDLTPENFSKIQSELKGKFIVEGNVKLTHANNYLTTANSIYPYEKSTFRETKRLIKRLFSNKKFGPYPMLSSYLAIMALKLRKV